MKEQLNGRYHISKEDWSLHRKGYDDQKRHEEKVREAIRNNLSDLISEENIILSQGKEVVKIPIRSLEEYKIRYNYDQSTYLGQGDGGSEIGDVIAEEKDKGQSGGAGKEAGKEIYEIDVTLEEIEKELFAELALPNLQKKEEMEVKINSVTFNDIRKKGLIGNIDKKKTILSAMKRNALTGTASIHPILEEDLRFRTWSEEEKTESKAVVLAMMDTSGSMGNFEKYIARTFFFWMVKFLRTKYETVDIEFIAHHTEAKVVTEEEFFHKGESGGTKCSSAYLQALNVIKDKYTPSRYNIYPFHFSDGENITSDNALCLELVYELLKVSNLFGYGEINAYNRHSTLMHTLNKIKDPKFRQFLLKEKRHVYAALKSFFTANVER